MLEEQCGGELLYHRRKSFIKIGNCEVPYPFQNNLGHLPSDKALRTLLGLMTAKGGKATMPFNEWMVQTFGEDIVNLFMRPYNWKVWATEAEKMSSDWIDERVSIVSFEEALKGVLLRQADDDWGPNRTFVFPLRGGTGEIFRRLAASLPKQKLKYNKEVVGVNLAERTICLNDGSRVRYEHLITSMPVDVLVRLIEGVPECVLQCASLLRHSGTYAVGCGVTMPLKGNWCWMYFPELSLPFNRVTNFAHYSPFNVPLGRTDRYCAFMCETSFSDCKSEKQEAVEVRTWEGLHNVGFVPTGSERASSHVMKVDYAYPVPTLGRNEALRVIQLYLMEHRAYSRGRFGAWMYEIGNMDHSYKQGIDVVDFIIDGKEEKEWHLK